MQEFRGLGNTTVLGNWEEKICEYIYCILLRKSDKLLVCAALVKNFIKIIS